MVGSSLERLIDIASSGQSSPSPSTYPTTASSAQGRRFDGNHLSTLPSKTNFPRQSIFEFPHARLPSRPGAPPMLDRIVTCEIRYLLRSLVQTFGSTAEVSIRVTASTVPSFC